MLTHIKTGLMTAFQKLSIPSVRADRSEGLLSWMTKVAPTDGFTAPSRKPALSTVACRLPTTITQQ
ncbi:hypothetical protein CXF87_14790 [Halomonas sp. MES3-P3E]|nr:hypothetical protein CXF87_14790 [Halomonas sp. MES3-P3E]